MPPPQLTAHLHAPLICLRQGKESRVVGLARVTLRSQPHGFPLVFFALARDVIPRREWNIIRELWQDTLLRNLLEPRTHLFNRILMSATHAQRSRDDPHRRLVRQQIPQRNLRFPVQLEQEIVV